MPVHPHRCGDNDLIAPDDFPVPWFTPTGVGITWILVPRSRRIKRFTPTGVGITSGISALVGYN